MDKINVGNSSVFHSVFFSSEKNERIVNSTITKLEVFHCSHDIQRNAIFNLLNRFISNNSASELIAIRKDIIRELNNMSEYIYNMRGQIFSIVNRNTDQVYGVLNEGFTINDRDWYVKELMYYHKTQERIKEVTSNYLDGHFAIMAHELDSYHNLSLWGDMTALQHLINGGEAKVPDFTSNDNILQYG